MKSFESNSNVDAFGRHDNKSDFSKLKVAKVPPQVESCGLQFEVELQSTGIAPLTKQSMLE